MARSEAHRRAGEAMMGELRSVRSLNSSRVRRLLMTRGPLGAAISK